MGMTNATTSLLNIRPARPTDFDAIASIYNEAIAHGGITMDAESQTAEAMRAIAQKMNPRELFLVAEVPGQHPNPIIGWGIIKRYSDRMGYQVCCETSIYLSFSEVNKGYGRILQEKLMSQVKDFGYHHIVAKILGENQGSVRFHQQFGFEIVGIQKEIGFVHDRWHDVVIMQCLLNP